MRIAKSALWQSVALATVPFTVAQAHLLDHPVPTNTGHGTAAVDRVQLRGEGAQWELLATIPTLNPHSDLDFFQQDGETYASLGNLGVGANGGGQIIVKLTEDGEVSAARARRSSPTIRRPRVCRTHPRRSASSTTSRRRRRPPCSRTPRCPSRTSATPSCCSTPPTRSGAATTRATAGLPDAPRGGLEIIDVTDVDNPNEIGLTSHIGAGAHRQRRPAPPAHRLRRDVGLASASTPQGERANETGTGRALDGFEVVNLRSCLTAPLGTIPAGATVDPEARAVPPGGLPLPLPDDRHRASATRTRARSTAATRLEVYPDDRLTCALRRRGDRLRHRGHVRRRRHARRLHRRPLRGTALPCAVRATPRPTPLLQTGAKVTDCVTGVSRRHRPGPRHPGLEGDRRAVRWTASSTSARPSTWAARTRTARCSPRTTPRRTSTSTTSSSSPTRAAS